jgi:hypothetical protein
VNGEDLKADLRRIDEYYSAFPEEQKGRGLFELASHPPNDDSYIVTRLWNKHMKPPDGKPVPKRPIFEGKALNVPPAGSDPKEILKVLNDFEAKAVPLCPDATLAMDEAAVVTIQRFVRPTKGKWKRVPDTKDEGPQHP